MTRRKSNADAPRQRAVASAPAPYAWFDRRPWFLPLVLVLVIFVVYQPTWRAGFIWDDDDHLTANTAVAASNGLPMIWSSLAVSRYYPLTLTSFWVGRRLWGLNPLPYHLVNVALHATNGILLFFLLRRLRVRAAWLVAMLWALHPVNVESVAWISELKNTQSGLFFFLAVLCFLRFEADARRRWYVFALLCGLAALLSKPSTVVLPLALLLCVWWQRGSWRRTDIARIAPFFVLALGMSALTVVEQRGAIQRAGTTQWNPGVAGHLLLAGQAAWFYVSKVLWPARLTFVYPRWKLDTGSFVNWLPLIAMVAGVVLLWVWRRQSWARAGWFGCGFFILALLPVLGFFDVFYFRYSYVADHFQYLASIGLIALVVSMGTAIGKRAGPWGRDLGTVSAAIALLILGASTWRQAHIYHDPKTLWTDTLVKNPQCSMAHNNLGTVLMHERKLGDAIGHFEQALEIDPDDPEAHTNLGTALFQTGQREEAIEHYHQALRINPDYAQAHADLGIALAQMGNFEEAIAHAEQALRIDPDRAEVRSNLGNILVRAGRVPEGIAQYEQALRINPDLAAVHYNLGNALARVGRVPEAIVQYEQALRIKPDFTQAQTAIAQLQAGQ